MIRRRIRRTATGCQLNLPAAERSFLQQLPSDLEELLRGLDTSSELPENLRRLFPRAYSTDDEAESSFAASTRDELLESKLTALGVLRETARLRRLDEGQMADWLTALNDMRLVIGTALGITEEGNGTDGKENPVLATYHYLTYLQFELVDVMEAGLPDPVAGADEEAPEDPWGEPLGGLRWDGTPLPPEVPGERS